MPSVFVLRGCDQVPSRAFPGACRTGASCWSLCYIFCTKSDTHRYAQTCDNREHELSGKLYCTRYICTGHPRVCPYAVCSPSYHWNPCCILHNRKGTGLCGLAHGVSDSLDCCTAYDTCHKRTFATGKILRCHLQLVLLLLLLCSLSLQSVFVLFSSPVQHKRLVSFFRDKRTKQSGFMKR